MPPSDRLVSVETVDGVCRIRLDSPHNRNALSDVLVGQLHDAFDRVDADPKVRVVELGHTGGTFCAGADLRAAHTSSDPARERADQLVDLLERIVSLSKPVVGRIDGHVRAGGMGLVAACDLVVSSRSSTFALTEVRLGLAASVISLTVLPRLNNRDAVRLFLTADTIDADRAAAIGLVSEAADDLDGATRAFVASLLSADPQGLRETKRLLNRNMLQAFADDRARLVDLSARLFASPEAQKAIESFMARPRS